MRKYKGPIYAASVPQKVIEQSQRQMPTSAGDTSRPAPAAQKAQAQMSFPALPPLWDPPPEEGVRHP